MIKPLRLYILAGEPSGDRVAADLVARVRQRVRVELAGVGGDALAGQGLATQFDMHELSVMGWADVLPRLPKLLWRSRQVARAIARMRPDVAVLVDSQVFSAIVARQVYRMAPEIPVVLCVAPAAWAWKPERARELSPRFREVLAVLPFEPGFMRKAGGPPTSYIGHPALETFHQRERVPDLGPLLLLPGSREGELRRHLPLLRAVAAEMATHPRVTGFILPTPHRLHDRVATEVSTWNLPVRVVSAESERQSALAAAVAAIAVTGTVTLELALAGIPMVTTYLADKGQAKRWFKYAVTFAALPNIILGRALVPEMLQVEPDPTPLISSVRQLLDDAPASQAQIQGFAEIRRMMDEGEQGDPRIDPAQRILAYYRP